MFKEIGYIDKYLIYTRQAYILQLQGVYSPHQEEKSSELLYTYALMKNGHYEKTLQQLKKIKPQNQSEDSFIKIEMIKSLYLIYHQESLDDFNLIKESEKMRYYIEMIYLNSQEEDCVCPPYYDLLKILAEMIYEFKNDPLQAIKINEINYEKQMEVYCPDSPMVQQTRRQNKKFWYYYLKQNENILDMQYYDLMQRLEKYAKLDPNIEITESEENLDDQYFFKIQQSEILGLNNN
ncbi:hypothetical protein PPERSA_01349 [Pseudocohnilembus persalinus]|uniref:Uncharacterized protein n=1 Tax=Pseudocohnilembus persalinus TaxID=266149 RepID=A0A0V0QGX5_PSEPJ|nr:hypothetical protein PPERSA_01349 [Pseudocohnilembus persalinus]|eukprot:KRX01446.1 hypothetical protein PPERSA_01349 [Pseudocohnilembus persalinus]